MCSRIINAVLEGSEDVTQLAKPGVADVGPTMRTRKTHVACDSYFSVSQKGRGRGGPVLHLSLGLRLTIVSRRSP